MYLHVLVLPLLIVFAVTFANNFWGGSVTIYPKEKYPDGSSKVEFRFKQTFDSCEYLNWTLCSNCGTQTSFEKGVIYNTTGRNAENFNWCQTEGVMTRQISAVSAYFYIGNTGCCWVTTANNFSNWYLFAFTLLGNRSDTNKANRPPVITSISFVSVPQNCPRTYKLVMFDPDNDQGSCFGNLNNFQVEPLPAGFTLNTTSIKEKDFCTLSYSKASTGLYGFGLVVLDLLRQNINLTYTNGSHSFDVSYPQRSALSEYTLFFAVKGSVCAKIPPPTPENGETVQAVANQELEIIISATSSALGVGDVIMSGPLNATVGKLQDASHQFVLTWTPRREDEGEYFPICFIAESNQVNNTYYQSDMRCVIVKVGNFTDSDSGSATPTGESGNIVVGLQMRLQSETLLTEREIEEKVIKQFEEELIRRGLPNTTTVRLRRVHQIDL